MPISENLAKALMQYKREYALSFEDLSQKLGLGKNSTVAYCHGKGNPRTDTLEDVAAALGVPIAEIVSGPLHGQEQAETIARAAEMLSGLSPERRERGVQLFLQLAALFSEENQA